MAQDPIKILYIEDEPYDVTILEETLRSAPDFDNHYEIAHTPDLFSGLDRLQTEEFHVILLDMNLPEGSGRKNVEMIKKFNAQIPIICLTSLNDDVAAMDAPKAGAQEYIVKGFSNPHILNRIIHSSIFRKHVENDLLQDARYDTNTGLPNSIFVHQTIDTMIKAAQDWRYKDALLLIRISNFEEINKTYGHGIAREIFAKTARNLKKTAPEEFTGVLNEGEFVVYIRNNTRKDIHTRSVQLAEQLIDHGAVSYIAAGEKVNVRMNVGIAVAPESGRTYEALVDSAYDAVIVASSNGGHSKYCIASENFMRPGKEQIRVGA